MCSHQWLKVHEQSFLGGSFPVGWQCENCGEYVSLNQITPTGLGGVITGRHKLVGIHGNRIMSASGRDSHTQIYDEKTGELSYEN